MYAIRSYYEDSPISKGFGAFMAVFFFIFLWRGSDLYVQVYDLAHAAEIYPFRFHLRNNFV